MDEEQRNKDKPKESPSSTGSQPTAQSRAGPRSYISNAGASGATAGGNAPDVGSGSRQSGTTNVGGGRNVQSGSSNIRKPQRGPMSEPDDE